MPLAAVPGGRGRRLADVVEDRAEDRERAVVVVEDLQQAALLRPVGLGGDADAPEAAAAARVREGVDELSCEWPATQAITLG